MAKTKLTTGAAVIQPAKAASTEKSNSSAVGFYCYIGPSIVGLIQHGDIYRGTREEALAAASAAIEKYPMIKPLIVPGENLPDAHVKVKKPDSSLYMNYQIVAGKM